jgi:hypothetical protein
MSKAFSFQGALNYPPDSGQPVASRAFSQSGSFTSKAEYEYVLTGAGTQIVDFGSVTKAKAVLIDVHADSAAPVNVIFNGGTEPIEISPGGFAALASPTPSTGISGLALVHSDDANVDVYVLE